MAPRSSRPVTDASLDPRAALSASHLGSLPGDVVDRLLTDTTELSVLAGSTFHRARDRVGHVEIVVSGPRAGLRDRARPTDADCPLLPPPGP